MIKSISSYHAAMEGKRIDAANNSAHKGVKWQAPKRYLPPAAFIRPEVKCPHAKLLRKWAWFGRCDRDVVQLTSFADRGETHLPPWVCSLMEAAYPLVRVEERQIEVAAS